MNKREALGALRRGEKLTHSLFGSNEWIARDTENPDRYLAEDGCRFPASEFWADRTEPMWENNWSIYRETN